MVRLNFDPGDVSPRAVLARLAAEHGEDYASLSRLIGRNAAYIQQFIHRGSPRRLEERDRRCLADYFGVDESLLGAPPASRVRDTAANAALMVVPRLDIGASAGGGALVDGDDADLPFAFDPRWLRRLSASPRQLAIIRVAGDSMAPTLTDGDDIMVDSADGVGRLRDGIYVLRRDDVLLVKRLAYGSAHDHVTIISDNPAYPTETAVPVDRLVIVGRVLWTGRRIG